MRAKRVRFAAARGRSSSCASTAYDAELDLDNPWLRLGLHPHLLDIANTYLGMWAKLEYVDVWYTPPIKQAASARSSQRWHRDFNDRHLLKAFLYLVDVDEDTGPFEYVPRTAPGNELDHLWPWRPLGDNYPPDDQFAAKIADHAVSFTAPKGTLIFCNTCGFHRGGFATGKPRVLATVTWSSPASLASLTERNFTIRADGSNGLRPQPAVRPQLKNGLASTVTRLPRMYFSCFHADRPGG